jgi:hypothetical protein
LPEVFRFKRVSSNDAGRNVIGQIGRNSQFAPVQSCVAQPINTLVGPDLQGDNVSSWTAHKDIGADDLHTLLLFGS